MMFLLSIQSACHRINQSLTLVCAILLMIGCSSVTESNHSAQAIPKTGEMAPVKSGLETVYIQPLGAVDTMYINQVQRQVVAFFGTRCEVRKTAEFTDDILAASGTRYEAEKILAKFKTNENLLILTEADIACKKGKYPEWGVFGLGYRPGKTCVVSTFRLKKKAYRAKRLERVTKVSLHEIGHNLGLNHCNAHPQCLMNDANGKISQVDKEALWFCMSCTNQLK